MHNESKIYYMFTLSMMKNHNILIIGDALVYIEKMSDIISLDWITITGD